jgi:hypothetical protein
MMDAQDPITVEATYKKGVISRGVLCKPSDDLLTGMKERIGELHEALKFEDPWAECVGPVSNRRDQPPVSQCFDTAIACGSGIAEPTADILHPESGRLNREKVKDVKQPVHGTHRVSPELKNWTSPRDAQRNPATP